MLGACTGGRCTFSVSVAPTWDVLAVAVIVATAFCRVTDVRTAKLNEVMPPGTTMTAGGCTSVGLLLLTAMLSPPLGADCPKLTVAIAMSPPLSEAGFRVNEVSGTCAKVKVAETFFALEISAVQRLPSVLSQPFQELKVYPGLGIADNPI